MRDLTDRDAPEGRGAGADADTRCQHEGCESEGIACYLNLSESDGPGYYYCVEHCYEEGFCWGCGNFSAGEEAFDWGNPSHLCSNCRSAGDYDDSDDDDEEYIGEIDFDPYDEQQPGVEPEPTNHRYLTGQEQRQIAARRASHKRERQGKTAARRKARR